MWPLISLCADAGSVVTRVPVARPNQMTARPPHSTDAELRRGLASELARARRWTDELFATLTAEALFARPIAERHRLFFYLGHLEAFDFNLLCRDVLGQTSSAPAFERLFAFGIDPVDGQLPSDQPSDWPAVEVVRRWNDEVRARVDEAVTSAPLTGWLEGGWAIHLAIEHRLMHAETLAYLLARLPVALKHGGPAPSQRPGRTIEGFVTLEAGTVELGTARAEQPFLGWDNEYERHRVEVPTFRLARRPVSNADWLGFLEAGGYQDRAWWSDAAWAWRAQHEVTHPAFWLNRDGGWWWKAMFHEVPLPLDWPVYVSHAEASAYARWKGARLPTEAEWHRAARTLEPETWVPGVQANVGGAHHDPFPIGAFPASDTAEGVVDLMGNGWEWTSTPFAPFEGFEPLPFYRGYSANFFDGQHFVLKGASAATDVRFLRKAFRNWFQPHYQHVFAKFRLAERSP